MSTMVETQPPVKQNGEITLEGLLAMPDRGHYELVDGELKERNASLLSSRVALRLGRHLDIYCEQHDLGWVLDAECGYRCFSWKPRLVRRPDVSFIDHKRLPGKEHWSEGYVTIPPDLAVEVISPTDIASDLDRKVEEYLQAGVRLVWVVNPETHIVQVIHSDGPGNRLRAEDELSQGEDVVPGFRCRVGDLFPMEAAAPAEPDAIREAPSS